MHNILDIIGLPKTDHWLGISLDNSEILVPLPQLKLHTSLFFYSNCMEILGRRNPA